MPNDTIKGGTNDLMRNLSIIFKDKSEWFI
jgi:hypothetical protein